MLTFETKVNFGISSCLSRIFGNRSKQHVETLVSRLRQEVSDTQNQCKPSTHKNKVTAVNTFERFLNEHGPIALDDLTPNHIKTFERWASDKGMAPGYVALHMRTLRALFNRINGHGNELFKNVRTANCQTEKKAVSQEVIRRIRGLQLPDGSSMALARDIFLFSFYGMGIPLIDAVMLKKSQLRNGCITYQRQKTKRQVKIKVEPELEQLLQRLTPKDSPYLLPVLTSTNGTEVRREYKCFYQRYMRALRGISIKIGGTHRLTSYTPRHSWASIAYQKGVNINVIARALGHANANITLIYIKEINDPQLENANHIVMQAIQ